ncbi:MAG: Flp pilus assembly protein CpaB [Geminicoccaceae bacterium]
MSVRRLVLPLVALALAGGAAWTARSWLAAQHQGAVAAATEPAAPHKQVLVAAVDLRAGQFVEPDAVRWQDWPDVSLPDSYLVKGVAAEDELTGAVVRLDLPAGQPIARSGVVRPGDRGFLAAVLDPGMRAISVPVDEASGNAGLIFPGDRVDLILTQTLGGDGGGDAKEPARRVSETVLADVRVIAMGRRLRTETEEEQPADKARTATLEVTPAGAEKVALVTDLGRLSLSLRSLALAEETPADPAPGSRFTWDSDVARALRPENQPTTTLAVIRGGESLVLNVPKGARP